MFYYAYICGASFGLNYCLVVFGFILLLKPPVVDSGVSIESLIKADSSWSVPPGCLYWNYCRIFVGFMNPPPPVEMKGVPRL